ncbi:hypothetical protein G9A89_014149 [Geosiphon pyriformis]|nr:hypothetical protein G9A89_014149 [Geosiphon pyriformis]
MSSINFKRDILQEPDQDCPDSSEQAKNLKRTILKRVPQRPATLPTDIYVSQKSKMRGLLEYAKSLLLKERLPSITIHGLGKAIPKSINLVMHLREATHNQIEYKAITRTVELIDDILPEDEEKALETQIRHNSSVHITVSLKEGALKSVNLP